MTGIFDPVHEYPHTEFVCIALYRLVELSSGSIHIDGIDISKLGLTDLRSALAIIPQDPVCLTPL